MKRQWGKDSQNTNQLQTDFSSRAGRRPYYCLGVSEYIGDANAAQDEGVSSYA
jgi:hypothetical protein